MLVCYVPFDRLTLAAATPCKPALQSPTRTLCLPHPPTPHTQVEAAVEAKLRGPHSFPLERLLHIFYAIYADHDGEDDDDEEEGGQEEVRTFT